MKKIIITILSISSLCFAFRIYAGEIVEFQISGKSHNLIQPHSFSIYNDAPTPIVFYLAPEDEDFRRYQLPNNMIKEFTDRKSDRYKIKIPTAGKESVIFVLTSTKRYQISWDEDNLRWAIFELNPR
jgi:hypothetical protein